MDASDYVVIFLLVWKGVKSKGYSLVASCESDRRLDCLGMELRSNLLFSLEAAKVGEAAYVFGI